MKFGNLFYFFMKILLIYAVKFIDHLLNQGTVNI